MGSAHDDALWYGQLERERLAKERREDEQRAIRTAQRERKNVTYLDTDGCEVTVTPAGHVFYNAVDWW